MVDPISAYHYVNNKIHHPENGDDEYTGPEMARDIAILLLATKTLILHNVDLAERCRTAEKNLEDNAVTILQKDMENYELLQTLTELKESTD